MTNIRWKVFGAIFGVINFLIALFIISPWCDFVPEIFAVLPLGGALIGAISIAGLYEQYKNTL